jgi:replicative DNA helicase
MGETDGTTGSSLAAVPDEAHHLEMEAGEVEVVSSKGTDSTLEPPSPTPGEEESPDVGMSAADLQRLARQSQTAASARRRPARTLDRMMPHNVEAEEAVLGSLLIDPDAIFKVAAYLTPADFYIERNGWVYEAILALYDRREAVDFITLCDELERHDRLEEAGGAAYVTQLINVVPTSIHVEYYGHIVEHAAVRRRLIRAATEIAALAYKEAEDIDQVVDRAEQVLFGVSQRRLTRDLVPIRQVISEYYDRIDYLYRHGDEFIGVPTGFPHIDRLLGGLQKSDLVIVAGRPAMGKTSLALNIAHNAALKNQRVAIFSLEMSNEQLVQRLIASETGISSHRLRTGKLKENEWDKFAQATGILSDQHIFIDDTPSISAMQMRTKSRRLHAEHGLDLIIVDYLQLMQGDRRSENRVQEISYISRMLKSLARELNVPVMAASQLSRAVEQRHDKRPLLSDLRESGCLSGDTYIMRADTGELVSIHEIAKRGEPLPVLALGEHYRLQVATMRKAWYSGLKPTYKLHTRMERKIRASANHPFRCLEGWRRLDQLQIGDRIAVPRKPQLPRPMDKDGCLQDPVIADVYWDRVANIEKCGKEPVYDAEVAGLHNFVANDIIVKNSIEQDADVVMFIYREEVYEPETPKQNIAEVIVSKHRHGPTGIAALYFEKELTRFRELERDRVDLEF